jgi:hypothetical protein
MKTEYQGSCHCGAVRFACQLDLAPAGERSPPAQAGVWWTSTFRCNCSSCWKTRFWKAFVPAGDFRLLQGRQEMSDYQFGSRQIHHTFCRNCGVHPFASASLPQMGGDFYAVNVACLDDVTPEELARAPITYEDGRHDTWERPPPETRYL